jgi:hypothetical protein
MQDRVEGALEIQYRQAQDHDLSSAVNRLRPDLQPIRMDSNAKHVGPSVYED